MGALLRLTLVLVMTLALSPDTFSATGSGGGVTAAGKTGTISGQILSTDGVPLAGGVVYFFDVASGPPPAHEKYWRVPDFMKPLDTEGKFDVPLPGGTYYLGATKKLSGKTVGPPSEGDYFFISVDDKGSPLTYGVKNDVRLDLGRIAKGTQFRSSTVNYGKGITAIEGIILDNKGKPVADAHVFAFVSAATVGRPLFTSEPTGKNGKFVLRVHDGGTFYLKVRSIYGGGPPVAGEMIGEYGEKKPIAVTVNKGERLQGLTIQVKKFLGRGPRAVKQ